MQPHGERTSAAAAVPWPRMAAHYVANQLILVGLGLVLYPIVTFLIAMYFQQQMVPEVPPAAVQAGPGPMRLIIPKLGRSYYVGEGVTIADLRKGPGHYPQTPMPGEPGNAAIAGHRTTYGAPFFYLDRLQPGDVIVVERGGKRYTFHVEWQRVVRRDDWSVIAPTDYAALTLTTCHPRFSARQRLVIRARLAAVAPVAHPTPGGGPAVAFAP